MYTICVVLSNNRIICHNYTAEIYNGSFKPSVFRFSGVAMESEKTNYNKRPQGFFISFIVNRFDTQTRFSRRYEDAMRFIFTPVLKRRSAFSNDRQLSRPLYFSFLLKLACQVRRGFSIAFSEGYSIGEYK